LIEIFDEEKNESLSQLRMYNLRKQPTLSKIKYQIHENGKLNVKKAEPLAIRN
jgi:hypothetical protein